MLTFRSLLFDFSFYVWSTFSIVLMSPTLIMPRRVALFANTIWTTGVFWICDHILGLRYEVKGWENLPKAPFLIASKHQSAWETFVFHLLVKDPAFVLKKQLLWIPFFGWFLKKLGMIPISRTRNKALQDLKLMLSASDVAIKNNQTIVIFPEGTRASIHKPNLYHSGVASLYQHLNIPVVPVAHNAGVFWPRRSFVKKSGCIQLEFLPAIQPGLSRKEFMSTLENRIEEKTQKLVRDACGKIKIC